MKDKEKEMVFNSCSQLQNIWCFLVWVQPFTRSYRLLSIHTPWRNEFQIYQLEGPQIV